MFSVMVIKSYFIRMGRSVISGNHMQSGELPDFHVEIYTDCILTVGRDSSVGIATRYGLVSPGIEARWGGEIFSLGPTQPPVQWVPGHSRG